ncbi:hypothetical protein [Streptomyces olivochromogenes]|uniref:hypothetical protein n=1 Tax=Streptomyces olivochromogenes TaxID=1963 RepID=UPI0007495F9C|nr:hypothetical protein [Streptomyces olivochromogenes]KUN45569.1 hypothetical protein AQJ27_21860 [Streptomyces olivochromogenes]
MTYNVRFAVLVAITVASGAVGCSSNEQKQEYTVPKALCGVSVPTDALSHLLPASGKKLTADEVEGSSEDVRLCKVTVDDVMVLTLSRERIDAGDSAQHILFSQLSIARPKSAQDGTIAYADQAAVSLIKCRGAGVEKEDISTLVKVLKPARPDESAMKNLISGYTAALNKQGPCKRGS